MNILHSLVAAAAFVVCFKVDKAFLSISILFPFCCWHERPIYYSTSDTPPIDILSMKHCHGRVLLLSTLLFLRPGILLLSSMVMSFFAWAKEQPLLCVQFELSECSKNSVRGTIDVTPWLIMLTRYEISLNLNLMDVWDKKSWFDNLANLHIY